MIIAPPNRSDRHSWQLLYQQYAEFYQRHINNKVMDNVWAWIFNDSNPFYCLVAKNEQAKVIALMHYRAMPSPLRGQYIGFLDDLFIDPNYRGTGLANQLFRELKKQAQQNQWPLIRWITRADNLPARKVYDRFSQSTDWITYEMDSDTQIG